MIIEKVTITGADDRSNMKELADLSAEFPFVEWGILVSKKQEGRFRFPSRDWIEDFSAIASSKKLNVSTHVCGQWVRDMLIGELDWSKLPMSTKISQRVQINTHAEPHVSTTGLFRSLYHNPDKVYIFQWDGLNDHLTYAANAYGFNVAALFDTSGGAGVAPRQWPNPPHIQTLGLDVQFGFAGGLGPDNVRAEMNRINEVCPKDYRTWIDMERRVRSEDDSTLDLTKVRKVLESVAASQWLRFP